MEMIKIWYGDTQHRNDTQKELMLDTASFFEMHTSSNVHLKDQIMNDIRARHPTQKLFSQEMLIEKDLFIKFREHINGMGIESGPSENIPHNVRVHIKVAFLYFLEFISKKQGKPV